MFLNFLFLILFSYFNTFASTLVAARIGNNFYDTLEEAIEAASSTDTITLTKNVTLDETMEIKKTVNINLNNHTISGKEKVFLIEGGSLNLTGTGVIRENEPYYGAIMLKGSEDSSDVNYSTLSVSNGVTLEGWSGIFIDHNSNQTGYGILVNMNGTIKAVDDKEGGTGVGVYVNGNIKHKENSPIINLSDTVKITSTGNGIYSAGYATYNINGSYIEGVESGLGIKSGVFNINDATILGTGDDETPTSGNNNGINASGVSIQMESNSGYAGDIELYIKDGSYRSFDSYVLYEYVVNSSPTKVKNITISDGNFVSDAGKDTLSFSSSFDSTHSGFITGGTYSSNPTPYLKSGYTASLDGDKYVVTSTTMGVFGENNSQNSPNLFLILSIISIIILGIVFFFKRDRILDFISNLRNR